MLKILMIEDSIYKGEDIQRALADLGEYDIVWSKTKEAGIRMLSQMEFDLLVLDMYFPLVDGGKEYPDCGMLVLKWIEENNYDISVIVCSTVYRSINKSFVLDSIVYEGREGLADEFKIILEAYNIMSARE